MATASQISAFASTWGPYAQQAGASLGVGPGVILSQWALESGYGTNSGAAANNVAGIMAGGVQQQYTSPQQFEQAYVNTIATNFPKAVGAGTNASAFVAGLANGTLGAYYGSGETYSSYETKLTGTGNTLAQTAPTIWQNLVGPGSTLQSWFPGLFTSAGQATAQAVPGTTTSGPGLPNAAGCGGGVTGLGGVFTWACWTGIAGDLAMVGIGVSIIVIAISAGVFGDATRKGLVAGVKKAIR